MNIEAIIGTFLSGAAFLKKPVQDAVPQSVKDVFGAGRYCGRSSATARPA
jgi:hypothetical protein